MHTLCTVYRAVYEGSSGPAHSQDGDWCMLTHVWSLCAVCVCVLVGYNNKACTVLRTTEQLQDHLSFPSFSLPCAQVDTKATPWGVRRRRRGRQEEVRQEGKQTALPDGVAP